MKTYLTKITYLLFFTLSLVACGGGGGGTTPPEPPIVQEGFFVDAAIEGAYYQSTSHSGFTDVDGTYQYIDGETITFSIGDLILGSVSQGQAKLTPLDFGNTQACINIARLLQSIDYDADPSNGITVTADMHTQLTGLSASLDFNQPSVDFAADTELANVLALIAPTTLSGSADLRTEEQTISHIANELNLGLVAGDVEGDFRVTFADQLAQPSDYSFTAFLNGSVVENSVVTNLTWQLEVQERLEVIIAGRAGLPQRFTLIEGTMLDGVLAVEIDQDQDGTYERFTLASIVERNGGSPNDPIIITLCGKDYNTNLSDNLSQHVLQFPINQQWNYNAYNGYTDDEYLTFTNVVYQNVPAIRIDNRYSANDVLIESRWYAMATDNAIYELNSNVDGVDYPCTAPNLRFPATLSTGLDWSIVVEGYPGTASIVSMNANSPAGYSNTIQIRQTFDFSGTIVNFDNYYRVGEGLLDWTDNQTFWIHRIEIAPDNPTPPPVPGTFGDLNISASLAQDAGTFTMTDSINITNFGESTISWTGDGITVVYTTLTDSVSMQGTTGVAYACACLPQVDMANMTITFNNTVLSDAFPAQPGPADNSVVLNGTLTIPDPQ